MNCPCCQGEFDRFLTFGRIPRPNARCPGCGSLERHRLAYLYLEREGLLARPGLRILHVAPEEALARPLLHSPGVGYLAIDREPGHIDAVMDLTQLACPDDMFDLVICNHVLEHIPDDRQAMRELRRVLRPHGRAIVQVPMSFNLATTLEDLSIVNPETRERLYGQADHVRLYGRDYLDRLTAAGFRVHIDRIAQELGEEMRARYGIVDEMLVVCTTDDVPGSQTKAEGLRRVTA
jgi:SAM-dependent methyltransferase